MSENKNQSYICFLDRKYEVTSLCDMGILINNIESNTALTKNQAKDIAQIIDHNYDMFLEHNIHIVIDGKVITCSDYFEYGALVELKNSSYPTKAIVIEDLNIREVKVRYLSTGYYDCILKNKLNLIAAADTKVAKAAVALMNEVVDVY